MTTARRIGMRDGHVLIHCPERGYMCFWSEKRYGSREELETAIDDGSAFGGISQSEDEPPGKFPARRPGEPDPEVEADWARVEAEAEARGEWPFP